MSSTVLTSDPTKYFLHFQYFMIPSQDCCYYSLGVLLLIFSSETREFFKFIHLAEFNLTSNFRSPVLYSNFSDPCNRTVFALPLFSPSSLNLGLLISKCLRCPSSPRYSGSLYFCPFFGSLKYYFSSVPLTNISFSCRWYGD